MTRPAEIAAALARWERTTGDVVHLGINEVYKAGAEMARLLRESNPSMDVIHIVFDGPPGPEAGRFVEVETADGKSISAGEWQQVGEYWHLIIQRTVRESNPPTSSESSPAPVSGDLIARLDHISLLPETAWGRAEAWTVAETCREAIATINRALSDVARLTEERDGAEAAAKAERESSEISEQTTIHVAEAMSQQLTAARAALARFEASPDA